MQVNLKPCTFALLIIIKDNTMTNPELQILAGFTAIFLLLVRACMIQREKNKNEEENLKNL